MSKGWLLAHMVVISVGALAVVLLVGGRTERPPICLVQVEGMSMYPTLPPGRELLFARLPYMPGDVVLADVGEDNLVVKRIQDIDGARIVLNGDNRARSARYYVPPHCILAVMVCKVPFTSPLGEPPQGLVMTKLPMQPLPPPLVPVYPQDDQTQPAKNQKRDPR